MGKAQVDSGRRYLRTVREMWMTGTGTQGSGPVTDHPSLSWPHRDTVQRGRVPSKHLNWTGVMGAHPARPLPKLPNGQLQPGYNYLEFQGRELSTGRHGHDTVTDLLCGRSGCSVCKAGWRCRSWHQMSASENSHTVPACQSVDRLSASRERER